MCRTYKIFFLNGVPDISHILIQLEKNSGLSDFKYSDGNLEHHLFKDVDLRRSINEDELLIEAFNMRTHYLEGALIQSLIDLGGEYTDSILPDWTKNRWQEIPPRMQRKII